MQANSVYGEKKVRLCLVLCVSVCGEGAEGLTCAPAGWRPAAAGQELGDGTQDRVLGGVRPGAVQRSVHLPAPATGRHRGLRRTDRLMMHKTRSKKSPIDCCKTIWSPSRDHC